MSPAAASDSPPDTLDSFRLLTRVLEAESTQRELTLRLSHITQTFTAAVEDMKAGVTRMERLLEKRDDESRAVAAKVTEFRGALKAISFVGALLISLAVAYFQLQVSSVTARIDRNETAIRELQRK